MTSNKLYRWFKVMFGSRSFVKKDRDGRAFTYVLIKGNYRTSLVIDALTNSGYTEEWPQKSSERL